MRPITMFLTAVFAIGAVTAAQEKSADATFQKWLAAYDEAFNAKDLEKLGSYYHVDATIFEGGGVDRGWASYRDHHLGPELDAFENLSFGHSNIEARFLGENAALVRSQYHLKTRYKERDVDVTGLATMVVMKGDDGEWRIHHSHTSSRRRQ